MMDLKQAISLLDFIPPDGGTAWGDAIIACREAARRELEREAEDKRREEIDATRKRFISNALNNWFQAVGRGYAARRAIRAAGGTK